MSRSRLLAVCSIAALFLLLSAAWAQQPQTAPAADTLKIDYFSNANTSGAPDGTLRITNPGTSGGNLCANIYVFDPNEEMSECCSCLTTPDGLLTLSINNDITGNPLTGVTLSTGVIKIVSSLPHSGTCPLPVNMTPTAALRSWVTHIQNSNFTITEDSSSDATLSSSEQNALQSQCNSIKKVGSGKGVCANSPALAAICNT